MRITVFRNKILKRIQVKSKRLRDKEHCQWEILKLIENLSAKVDSLANSSSLGLGCSSSRTETHENLQDALNSEYADVPD